VYNKSRNERDDNMNELQEIKSYEIAIKLLDNYLLISRPYGEASSIYAKASDGSILVINQNIKYYITKEDFKEHFNLARFYIYKDLNEVEIDQEFRNLRQ